MNGQPMTKVVEREKAKGITRGDGPLAPNKLVGIYIQVPFCQTKCTYCNFHTGVASPSAYAPYARAVEREIRNWRAFHRAAKLESVDRLESGDATADSHPEPRAPQNAPLLPSAVIPNPGRILDGGEGSAFQKPKEITADTIYLGGGTPSLFDPADLARILDAVHSEFCSPDLAAPSSRARAASPEATLEADPETIDRGKGRAWLAAGINRISLGAQSFHDAELKPPAACIAAKISSAPSHLFAPPASPTSAWTSSPACRIRPPQAGAIRSTKLLRLRPEHISIYLLEIDEGSRLGRELLAGGSRYSAAAVPTDDAMADFYEFACERLRQAGYDHYEISNWALPGFRSRHNLKYWRREPYLGFGAGAHSFDGRLRWANAHDPAAYVAAIEEGRLPIEQLEEVTPKQALEEEIFLGLRQLEGIDLARIEAQYGERQQAQYNRLGKRIEDCAPKALSNATAPACAWRPPPSRLERSLRRITRLRATMDDRARAKSVAAGAPPFAS